MDRCLAPEVEEWAAEAPWATWRRDEENRAACQKACSPHFRVYKATLDAKQFKKFDCFPLGLVT